MNSDNFKFGLHRGRAPFCIFVSSSPIYVFVLMIVGTHIYNMSNCSGKKICLIVSKGVMWVGRGGWLAFSVPLELHEF